MYHTTEPFVCRRHMFPFHYSCTYTKLHLLQPRLLIQLGMMMMMMMMIVYWAIRYNISYNVDCAL